MTRYRCRDGRGKTIFMTERSVGRRRTSTTQSVRTLSLPGLSLSPRLGPHLLYLIHVLSPDETSNLLSSFTPRGGRRDVRPFRFGSSVESQLPCLVVWGVRQSKGSGRWRITLVLSDRPRRTDGSRSSGKDTKSRGTSPTHYDTNLRPSRSVQTQGQRQDGE